MTTYRMRNTARVLKCFIFDTILLFYGKIENEKKDLITFY